MLRTLQRTFEESFVAAYADGADEAALLESIKPTLAELRPKLAAQLLKSLKTKAPSMLRSRRLERKGLVFRRPLWQ